MTVEFPHPVSVSRIEIRFQGGFAAQECTLLASLGGEGLQERAGFNPQDTNSLQVKACLLVAMQIRVVEECVCVAILWVHPQCLHMLCYLRSLGR